MDQSEDYKCGFEFILNASDSPDRISFQTQAPNKIDDKDDNNCDISVPNSEHYCRVCGIEVNSQSLVLIFGNHGENLELQRKILVHLHLEVKKDDHLPQKICLACISQLNECQKFFETSQTAASKLRQLFLPEKIDDGTQPIVQDSNENLSALEQDLIDSSNLEELQGDERSRNETDDDKTLSVTKKEKQQTSVLCHICGKAFKDMANLHSHKRTHLPENLKKKFPCTICDKYFRSNFHLSEHMNVHLGVTPYSCPSCDKRFHSRALLRQHAHVHRAQADDKNKVACPKCGLLCTRKGNLRVHMRTHLENRTFSCCLCQQQFPSFSEMLSHRKKHSQEDIKQLLEQDLIKNKDRIFPCQFCEKIFTDKRILMTHVQHVHEGASKYECGDCGKVLQSQRSLGYHRRSQHTGERPYRCGYCGDGFLLPQLLKAHEAKHTGERPFKCEVCGKGFRSRNNLHQHSQKHGGERRFECMTCGKNFQRKGALEVHKRIHSGEKPFVCDLCGRGFTQKNDLIKHQKTHSEGNSKTRTCEQCIMVFSSKKELLKHKEESHGDSVSVVPLIVTNNIYETHIITEDGQRIVFPAVDGALRQNNVVISSISDVGMVQ